VFALKGIMEDLTVRQNFCTLYFFAVRGKNFAVSGRNFPHPQFRFYGSGEQNVCAMMPEHALKMAGGYTIIKYS
jgi:hypothetical protein